MAPLIEAQVELKAEILKEAEVESPAGRVGVSSTGFNTGSIWSDK